MGLADRDYMRPEVRRRAGGPSLLARFRFLLWRLRQALRGPRGGKAR